MKLINKTSQNEICSRVITADSFGARSKGLIGTKTFDDSALFIAGCNWIHTFFMSIPIDVLYVDDNLVVKKVQSGLRPWRLPAPVFSAKAVFELPAGLAQEKKIKVGDALHVGD